MDSVVITALEIPELNGKEKTAYHFNELEQPLLSILVLADDEMMGVQSIYLAN